jgi:hypothetical protein
MDRFVIACCVFSFITGMYVMHLVELRREFTKSCVISFVQGRTTHVFRGREE